ncbi:MAG: LemA family protein [Candidatus Taylorbacteria bacterium RIFCSPHIGHO2_02_FULL_45_28]|uniref:LemA family protein n=1 Tax=Candidatus Taylorbacteria bacterium RIFCSPHIGHO2_12_FULL_45_16 TaxID=1802315 RepID=A0A1G2MYX0_9BACT|nr:MAG: LemA family protein [Candidatus Taylorbacteria bacterium RIFCSPHIGHO2_01_FULL_44_110]OHA25145.1 MAG: LemA family protein [Candidatus Taylorbacteria bacterium RIFCSPHIGHO2_02_FULL_45_28]OHA29024.1 MAG: LemA family protein [Candidatus Taylorbacteria bacterium RIFCSPHIGHO2_12_FULL_45_16]OHA33143.1 MAG: LemA family protein [Candidatus Taylorbacteria bacterium RIFCSPLOWO2_01_FULL_45_59]OHA39565.1 MAG: LemA family protein [Candidatus Taylorbacteria bacterium RIFCSPLOWO2_02_FULL_45_10b]OHA434
MKKPLIIIGIVIIAIVLYFWSSYNGLVTLRENATAQWQQVETSYQRRFDLIPNLVESVKGILTQEQTIFTALADARTRYAGAQTVPDKALAAGQLETSLGRLLAVIENYPTLKSSENVRDLMTQLEGTENRISTERGRFNDTIKIYQVAIQRFPRAIVASLFGFEKMEYFEAQAGAETAPKVDLQ